MTCVYLLLKRINLSVPGFWGTEDGLPPRDVPECGLRNEFCMIITDNTGEIQYL